MSTIDELELSLLGCMNSVGLLKQLIRLKDERIDQLEAQENSSILVAGLERIALGLHSWQSQKIAAGLLGRGESGWESLLEAPVYETSK